MNHPLVRALGGTGLNMTELAVRLDVDPKTVERWLAGRVPYPRHRAALVTLTGWSERDLWPSVDHSGPSEPESAEVRVAYPHWDDVPRHEWLRLFSAPEHHIDVLAYSALFLAEDYELWQLVREKARTGVRVRLALGDPVGPHITRHLDEDAVDVVDSIHTAVVLYGQLAVEHGIQLRLHDTTLYSSIYRFDDELLVNAHIYGCPAPRAPVLHVRRTAVGGVADTYLASFERVWEGARAAPL